MLGIDDGSDIETPDGTGDYDDPRSKSMWAGLFRGAQPDSGAVTPPVPSGAAAPAAGMPSGATPEAPPPLAPIDQKKIIPSSAGETFPGTNLANPNPSAPDVMSIVKPDAGAGKQIMDGSRPTIPAPSDYGAGDLITQRAAMAKPIDPSQRDDAGKPIYRPSIGQRIAGTVANFANGFARNGAPIIYEGPGATNQRFEAAKEKQAAGLSGLDTEIAQKHEQTGESQKLFDSAIKSAYDKQLGEAREKIASAAEERAKVYGENTDLKGQLVKSQEDLNEARANKANNNAPTNEFSGWYQAFSSQNGRRPSAQEIQQYEITKARAGKDTTAGDTAKAIQIAEYKGRQLDRLNAQQEEERRAKYAEADKDLTTKYDPAKAAAAKSKIDSDLEAKYAPKIQSISDEADKMLGLTKAGAKLNSNAPNPARPNAGKTPPKAGSTIMVDGKPRQVIGYNDKTKKPIVAPLAAAGQ